MNKARQPLLLLVLQILLEVSIFLVSAMAEEEESLKTGKFQLPLSLKQVLLLDAVAVEEGKLYSLPCTPSVSDILDLFLTQAALQPSSQKVIQDLVHLFDQNLGQLLLYHEERLQYRELTQASKNDNTSTGAPQIDLRMSSVYGGIHLLRLLSKLPLLMSKCSLPEESVAQAKEAVVVLYSFMEKHKNIFFCDVFETASLTSGFTM